METPKATDLLLVTSITVPVTNLNKTNLDETEFNLTDFDETDLKMVNFTTMDLNVTANAASMLNATLATTETLMLQGSEHLTLSRSVLVIRSGRAHLDTAIQLDFGDIQDFHLCG